MCRYSVRAAIKTVADAAATMYVSKLIRNFNSRAARLFKDTVEHMTKKQTAEYIALFGTMALDHGGFLLLQPVDSPEALTVTEHCTYAAQREDTGKRVRVIASVKSDDGRREIVGVVPRRNDAAVARTHADAFPAVSVIATTYRIIAGTVDRIGGTPWETSLRGIQNIRDLTWAYGVNPPPPNLGHLPTLMDANDVRLLVQRYTRQKYLSVDYEDVLRYIRERCEVARGQYIKRVDDLIAHLVAHQAAGLTPGDDVTNLFTYLLELYKWSRSDPKNYIIGFAYNVNRNMNAWTNNNPHIGWNAANQPVPSGAAMPGPAGKQFGEELRERLGLVTIILPNTADVLETTRASIEATRPLDMIVTCGDLITMEAHTEFDEKKPTDMSVAPAGGGRRREVADPTAITAAYRPIVLNRDNEVRFKMSLLPNKGFNPAFFGGAGAVGNLNVDASDERREFDENIKNWEFNLHVRNLDGYLGEWRAAMRTVVQVLVSRAHPPPPAAVPVVSMLNLTREVPAGIGFVYVPLAPDTLKDNPDYLKNIQLPVRPEAQQQFVDSFPMWTASKSVSAAALFWYRNAVATATEPFSIRSQATNMDDVAAMLASSSPFAVMTEEDRANAMLILNTIEAGPNLFRDQNTLHLIQVTKAAVAPGNSNFSQPFPPLRVKFRSASIEMTPTAAAGMYAPPMPIQNRQYELRYTLGCEVSARLLSLVASVAAVL